MKPSRIGKMIVSAALFFLSAAADSWAFAQEGPSEEDFAQVSAGLGQMPSTQWALHHFKSLNDKINIDFNKTTFTTFEGDIFLKHIGLNFGVRADVDNNIVEKAYRYAGYIGINDYYLRVQKGRMTGTAEWEDAVSRSIVQETSFDSEYTNVDLIRWRKTGEFDEYKGIGYTSYTLPMQVSVGAYQETPDNWVEAQDVFQQETKIEVYSFVLGFDTLHTSVSRKQEGVGAWIYMQDRFGIGTAELSEETIEAIQTANPGVGRAPAELLGFLVGIDFTAGIRYMGDLSGLRIGLGAGYNINGYFASFSSTISQTYNSVNVMVVSDMYSHGPVFNVLAMW